MTKLLTPGKIPGPSEWGRSPVVSGFKGKLSGNKIMWNNGAAELHNRFPRIRGHNMQTANSRALMAKGTVS